MESVATDISPTPEQFERLRAAAVSRFAEHEQERRRSAEIGASFFEKVAALSAGSIAVAATVGIAVIPRSGLPYLLLRSFSHWLFFIVLSLLIALLSAVLHNLCLALIAQLDAASARQRSIHAATKATLKAAELAKAASLPDAAAVLQLLEVVQGAPVRRREQFVQRQKALRHLVSALGALAVCTFLLAYILIMIVVSHLWL